MFSAIYFKLLRINAKYMRYSTLLENDKFIYLGKTIVILDMFEFWFNFKCIPTELEPGKEISYP